LGFSLDITLDVSFFTPSFGAVCILPLERHSQSLPLLLHHLADVVEALLSVLEAQPQDQNTYKVTYSYAMVIFCSRGFFSLLLLILLPHVISFRHFTTSALAVLPLTPSLLAAVAKDARHEIVPFLLRIVKALTASLQANNAFLLEQLFNTFCFLFKYLHRHIVDDLPDLFLYGFDSFRLCQFFFIYGFLIIRLRIIFFVSFLSPLLFTIFIPSACVPLLCHTKEYVRDFASQSFAYLLRQLPREKQGKTIERLYRVVEEQFFGDGKLV
jgi:hypothetical protein